MESQDESSSSSSMFPPSNSRVSCVSTLSSRRSSSSEDTPPGATSDSSETSNAAEVEAVNPLEGSTMEDVIMTDTERNQISQNRKKTLSKLHSIKDILVAKIEVRDLKLFCT